MDLTQSTAIVYDEGGGYKRFMAADPAGATRFQTRCKLVFVFRSALSLTAPAGAI